MSDGDKVVAFGNLRRWLAGGSCYVAAVSKPATFASRLRRLDDLVRLRFNGNRTALARVLGHVDGSFVRKMLNGDRPISETTVARIESALGIDGWFDQVSGVQASEHARSSWPPPPPRGDVETAGATRAPVLGTTVTGPARPLDWQEPWTPLDGDHYVDAIDAHMHVYALQVHGDALAPRSTDGEYLVMAPHRSTDAGDDVLMKTSGGEIHVGQLAAVYDEHVVLVTWTRVPSRLVRRRHDLEFMHLVSLRLPRRKGRRHVDTPGYRGPDRRITQLPVAVDRRRPAVRLDENRNQAS